MEHNNWNGFKGDVWKSEINVRDFIQTNYLEYLGDSLFLSKATKRTNDLMVKVQALFKEERLKGGVLDIDVDNVSSLVTFKPGYVDKDNELIVGLQTDKPLYKVSTVASSTPSKSATSSLYWVCISMIVCNKARQSSSVRGLEKIS